MLDDEELVETDGYAEESYVGSGSTTSTMAGITDFGGARLHSYWEYMGGVHRQVCRECVSLCPASYFV